MSGMKANNVVILICVAPTLISSFGDIPAFTDGERPKMPLYPLYQALVGI